MAAVKAGPVVAADVDPATAKIAVGGYVCHAQPISFNEGLPVTTLNVRNTGDRPVQVGSHFHFFEVNPALEFDRAAAFGLHLAHEFAGRSARLGGFFFHSGLTPDVRHGPIAAPAPGGREGLRVSDVGRLAGT